MQQLAGDAPDPGPMPADLVDRITASLAVEQAHRSPSSATTSPVSPVSPAPPVPPASAHPSSGPTEATTCMPFPAADPPAGRAGPARRTGNASRGWLLGLSGAAAAVAIGGVAALNMLGPSGGHAGGGSLAFGHFPIDSVTSGVEPGQGQQALLDPGAGSPRVVLTPLPPRPVPRRHTGAGHDAHPDVESLLRGQHPHGSGRAALEGPEGRPAVPERRVTGDRPDRHPARVTQCLDSWVSPPGAP